MSTHILWLRKGLRLHDNAALLEACSGSPRWLVPLVVIDPKLASSESSAGARPTAFFLDSLRDLDKSLKAKGSGLIVQHGDPREVVPRCAKEWGASKVSFELDTGRYGESRDKDVVSSLQGLGITSIRCPGHTLYHPDKVKEIYSDGSYPSKYEAFLSMMSKRHGPVEAPVVDAPEVLPGLHPAAAQASSPVPQVTDMGFKEEQTGHEGICETFCFPGGETEALKRMEEMLSDEKWICEFEKPKTVPTQFEHKPPTTLLSPYIARGCLSSRLLYKRITDMYLKRSHSMPPVSLEGQLLWREFYYAASYLTPNYYEMEGNPVCKDIDWSQDKEKLAAWKEGRTGYPWIDAAMTQLRTQGWIHHLARHAVACFLTRGDLWVDWRLGRDVFEEMLLDCDPALNNGNWQWVSASAYFYQYFRVYGPVSFPKKYDKNGDYVRKFLPKLSKMPAKYIYEPWKAPKDVQAKAGCIIGKDYPMPIVEHEIASKENMARMNQAYARNKQASSNSTPGTPQKKNETLSGVGNKRPPSASSSKAKSKAGVEMKATPKKMMRKMTAYLEKET